MKKIAILSTVNIKHMTLISLYTSFLEEKRIPYDIIFIDKYHEDEENNANCLYKYDLYIKKNWPKPLKAIKYFGFKKFAIKIMKKNNYDFIIVWNDLTAFMFAHFLKRKYLNKYSVNIRDISSSKIIMHFVKIAVNGASFSTVSSKGFLRYLPTSDYTVVHSLNKKILDKCIPHSSLRNKGEKIVITYIGYMCLYKYCYKLIEKLKNDDRYVLNFYGQGSDLIKEYCATHGIQNVNCIDRFEPSQTPSLIQNSDIIFNLYGFDNINLQTALSIKLYYALYLRVPILVFKNTYMSEVSEKYGFGISINESDFDSIGDFIYNKYYGINFEDLKNGCQRFLDEEIGLQYDAFIKKVEENLL